jgi:hypothetical protein
MTGDQFSSLVAGMTVAIFLGGTLTLLMESRRFRRSLRRLLGIQEPPAMPYSTKLAKLTASLSKASAEVDSVLAELSRVATERATTVEKLEQDLSKLEEREFELKNRIDVLQKTPIEVAEHFAKLLEPNERRSAKRDLFLFAAGVVAGPLVTFIIEWIRS